VLGDRRQLVSALHALIENAVTYSYEGSEVTVSARVSADGPVGGAPDPGSVPSVPAPGVARPNDAGPGNPGMASGAGPGDPGVASGAGPGDPGVASGAGPGDPGPGAEGTPARTDQVAPDGADRVARSANPGAPGSRGANDVVRISVVDHGIGIPARDLDRIFERFYRVDHGRSRETGGTGLGLSIVRHVASNHQGRVEVESREGEGSTFTLVLPLQPDRGAG